MRAGGLVAYTEDLMDAQVARGHDVTYFFAGRYYPFVSGPRLRRWENRSVAMLEVVNSPLYDHGRQPLLELDEPRIESMLERSIAALRPHVIHLHELAGLPTSLIDVAHGAGVPTVLTLQDYYPLCSTFKLLDHTGRVCLRREIGADCVATTAADPRPPGLLYDATIRYELLKRVPPRAVSHASHRIRSLARMLAKTVPPAPPATADAFQRRRDVNVDRMNRIDLLIAMSSRVAEIYALLGVDAGRIRTMQLTLAHLERLQPRELTGAAPVTFGTLNGLCSREKGSQLLVEATRRLSDLVPAGSYRLLVYGDVDPVVAADARAVDAIDLRGHYGPGELDSALDEIDVGIVPSIWEEAYGYVGVEFLAKGIPVIANAIGGMSDYTREGETGWLNHSLTASELGRIMAAIVAEPRQVADLNARIRAAHNTLIKPVARHAAEIDDAYSLLIGASTQAAL